MRIVIALAAVVGLSACDTPNFRTSQFQFGDSTTLAATGNLRFVSERTRLLPFNSSKVVCSEPSPDYAVGSGTDLSGAVKAASTSPISEIDGSLKTSEAVVSLGGRDKAVLALRDGLYATCQAYANGAIGKDAYSLVLSQYGLLLVAMMGDPTQITIGGDGKKAPVVSAARAEASSAFAAVLVSCINDGDPTRRDYKRTIDTPYTYNKYLSPSLCAAALRHAASGRMG